MRITMHTGLLLLGATVCVLGASRAEAKTIRVPADQLTIQLAVNDAGPGDTIVVSKGRYVENVVVPATRNGLTLKTKGKVIVDAAQVGNGFTVLADDVKIVGFTIWHSYQYGIRAYGPADRLRLEKLTILHGSDYAFYVKGDDLVIEDCEVRGCEGTSISGDRVRMTNTSFSNDGYGAYIAGDDVVVSKCRVDDSDGYGLYVDGDRTRLTKCDVTYTYYEAIYVDGDDVEVVGNTVANGKTDGIDVNGDRAVVEKNDVSSCQQYGISTDGDDVRLAKNVVTGSLGWAIEHYGSNGDVLGNTVREAGRDKCGLLIDGDGNLVAGNTVSRTIAEGIHVQGSGNELRDNVVRDCGSGDRACFAYWIEGDDNTLLDNLARENAGDGYYVEGARNLLLGNEAKRNLEDGVQVAVGAIDTEVRANTLTGNLGEGLENGGAGTIARKNVVRKNRLDVANTGSFASFLENDYVTGGPGKAPEIDT